MPARGASTAVGDSSTFPTQRHHAAGRSTSASSPAANSWRQHLGEPVLWHATVTDPAARLLDLVTQHWEDWHQYLADRGLLGCVRRPQISLLETSDGRLRLQFSSTVLGPRER